MNHDEVSELAQEMRDLLDAGRVGLYEFMWDLNSTHGSLSLDARRRIARQALDRLLADPEFGLVWMKWPDWDVIRPSSIDEVENLGAAAWSDIGDDRVYLAIDRITPS